MVLNAGFQHPNQRRGLLIAHRGEDGREDAGDPRRDLEGSFFKGGLRWIDNLLLSPKGVEGQLISDDKVIPRLGRLAEQGFDLRWQKAVRVINDDRAQALLRHFRQQALHTVGFASA